MIGAGTLLAATAGWAVFGVFLALCVVLAGFVVRFARGLNRRARDGEPPEVRGRDRRRGPRR